MEFPADLQQDIAQAAISKGISSEKFIIQTLIEKIRTLRQQPESTDIVPPDSSRSECQLVERGGILVIETASLDHIDFDKLIDQLRVERDQEQMCL